MARKTLESFIPTVTGQLKPLLDAFLSALGIRRKKEETGRVQKLQSQGRMTTGFVPEMYREVGEQFGMEETGFRASHQANVLEYAMKLFGLDEEWERMQEQMKFTAQQSELDRALSRELAKMSGAGGRGGISFDFGGMFGGGGGGVVVPDSFVKSLPVPIPKKAVDVRQPTKTALEKFKSKKVSTTYRGGGLRAPVTARKIAYQPTQKATTYRGVRLGRI